MREPINHNNYEAWLLDYIEGALPAQDEDQLLYFLKENPELCAEIDDLKPYCLVPSTRMHYTKKAALKKPEVSEEIIIAMAENSLNAEEIDEAHHRLSGEPEAAVIFNEYQHCKLVSDNSEYPHKSELKKSVFPLHLVLSAAAAIIIIFVSVGLLLQIDLSKKTLNPAKDQMLCRISPQASRNILTTPTHESMRNYQQLISGTENRATNTKVITITEREYFANIPSLNIQHQKIKLETADPAMNYNEIMLHEVAEYKEDRLIRFSFGSGSIASIAKNLGIKSPIKLLRKTKNEILSQDLLAEIRNLKN